MEFVIVLAFILLDVATGILQALKTKTLKSSAAREGIFHKAAYILLYCLFAMIDYAQVYVELGFHVNLSIVIAVYILMSEIISIIENLGKINPAIVPDKIKQLLGGKFNNGN